MDSVIRDDGNGGYIIRKTTGISIAMAVALIVAVAFYFQGQSSLEARVNRKIENTQTLLHDSVDRKVDKEDYREDMGHIRDHLNRIEEKIDRLVKR